MKCNKCNTDNPKEAKYCRYCGEKIQSNGSTTKVPSQNNTANSSSSDKIFLILIGIISIGLTTWVGYYEGFYSFGDFIGVLIGSVVVLWILVAIIAAISE